jgi:YceI-like domain
MKKITLYLLFLIVSTSVAQEKLSTSNCFIYFEASVPLFEAVEAKNEVVECELIPKKSQINFSVPLKDFQFKRDLMKEHFNENYMESKRFPVATFKGIIEKFDVKVLTEIEKSFRIKGKITIRGKSKAIVVQALIKKVNNGIAIKSNFVLNTDDFGIEIPSIVIAKISKNVNTQMECVLN